MKKLTYWIVFLVMVIIIIINLFFPNRKQEAQVTIFEFESGKVGESIDVPTGKYTHGFPIEVLEYKDQVIKGQRYISGYCRWHPDADPNVGRNITVVPVIINRLKREVKKIVIVGQTMTRRGDGYFQMTAHSLDGEYSIGVRIEKAENWPERFKKHPPKKDMKKEEKPITI